MPTPLLRLRARLHHWLTRPSPARYVAAGYLGYMAVGALLLMLPFAQAVPVEPLDALFIAVSAVSTTGLVSVDPGSSFTLFGEIVILLLIQFGGLGFMTLGSFAWAVLSRPGPSLRERVARTVFAVSATADVRLFLRRVVIYTAVVQTAGAIALFLLFQRAGVENAAWSAVFHAVSAFCTAGFSLYATSLEAFSADPAVLGVVALLSVLGAVGFLVAAEIWDRATGRIAELGVTARVVLWGMGGLILGGAVFFAATEPALAAMPPGQAAVNALFQSMTAATTVGFNSIPIGDMAAASVMVLYVLMLIGASPSGTGGGVKITTVALLLAQLRATARGDAQVTLLGHVMREERLRQASGIVTAALLILAAALIVLTATETHRFDLLLFEALSALGTVGLSLGISGDLSPAGQSVIIALMAIGRIGVLGFIVAVAARLQAGETPAEQRDVAV
jgi:trk system potassium uptake protein TrkH